MTDKNLLGNTHIEKLVKEMLDQAVLDPYTLDFLNGYHRGVSDALDRTAESTYNTFVIVRKTAEFPKLVKCFDALEHRMARNLFTIKSDLLRF